MSDDIDTANYADLKTLEDRVRRTLFAHGFNEKTSTPLGDMNSLCRNLVQDAAATDAELAALQARLAEAEAQRAVLVAALEHIDVTKMLCVHGNRERSFQDVSDATLKEIARIRDHALANQPPSDLVALVKAADDFVAALDAYSAVPSPDNGSDCDSAQAELEGAIDTLLQNQPGFRALIDGEDV